jgi:hypothetical protein
MHIGTATPLSLGYCYDPATAVIVERVVTCRWLLFQANVIKRDAVAYRYIAGYRWHRCYRWLSPLSSRVKPGYRHIRYIGQLSPLLLKAPHCRRREICRRRR